MPHLRSLFGVALVALTGCGFSHAQMHALAQEHRTKNLNAAKDPDIKAFWQTKVDCANKYDEASQAGGDATTKCMRDEEDKIIATVDARLATDKDSAKRDYDLKLKKCLVQVHETGMLRPYENMEDCVARIELPAEDTEKYAASSDYEATEKTNTPKAWIEFLTKHPKDKRAPAIVKRVIDASTSAAPDEQATLDEELVKAYPAAITDLPAERRLLMVGPPGLRVRDVKKMADAKIASSIVVARIRAATQPYKSFDGDELTLLKKMGISDDAVTAMIEVSSKLEDKQKADEERKALRAELDALRKLIEEKKASGGGQASGKTVQTKDGPMDALESCAKRLAAKKLCEQLPFPASTVCSSTTDTEFPCPEK